MAYELKPGQGTFFKNDKGDNAARPDYRGEVNVAGMMYKISGWIKEGKSGLKYMSLSVEEPQEKAAEPAKKAAVEDDIPFR